MANKTIRVLVRSAAGAVQAKEYESIEQLQVQYEQIGIDDCSTDLSLRGMPVFRGLVGPISESKSIARYEVPEVFEMLTKEWSQAKVRRRRRSSSSAPEIAAPNFVSMPQRESVTENV